MSEVCDACGERLPAHGGYICDEGSACNKGCLQDLIDGVCEDRTPRVPPTQREGGEAVGYMEARGANRLRANLPSETFIHPKPTGVCTVPFFFLAQREPEREVLERIKELVPKRPQGYVHPTQSERERALDIVSRIQDILKEPDEARDD